MSGATRDDCDIEQSRESASAYESTHVHGVYSAIADHFSSTRYKPWPRVVEFVTSLPSDALIADVGCGNGKNFCVSNMVADGTGAADSAHRFILGVDYSTELLLQAQRASCEFVPWTPVKAQHPSAPSKKLSRKEAGDTGSADNLSAPEAHAGCNGGGDTGSSSAGIKTFHNEGIRADALRVPLREGVCDAVLSIAVVHHFSTPERRKQAIHELVRLVKPNGGRVLVYVWASEQSKKGGSACEAGGCDVLIPWKMHQKYDTQETTHRRYYHLFEKGELERLCDELLEEPSVDVAGEESVSAKCRIVESFFDKENHCVVLERTR